MITSLKVLGPGKNMLIQLLQILWRYYNQQGALALQI